MSGSWTHSLWLVVVWVALWGDLTAANVLGGVAVAALVRLVLADATPGPTHRFHPLAALRLAGYFTVELVRANYDVAWAVLRRRPPLPAIVAVRLEARSDAVVTLIANAITLTPGTLTLEVERDQDDAVTLYLHVLNLDDPEALRAGLRRLERHVLAAFGTGTPGPHAEVAQ